MNYVKAQREIFNALCKGNRLAKFKIDENNVLVSPNGCMAYIFPISTIVFNIEKIPEIKPFPIAELIKPENQLELTNDVRITDTQRNCMARRLKGNGKNTFVNIKFLECFQNPKFYQAENNASTIVVTERIETKRFSEAPVGIILPIRAKWDDGTYYGDMLRN